MLARMRWLVLYLRSRQVLAGVGVAFVCAAGITALTGDSVSLRAVMAVFTVTVVTSVAAAALAGPDPALDRTAALDWRLRRAAHVVAIGALAVVLGVVVGPAAETEVVVRNAVGLTGLSALGIAVLGGGLAWCLPTAWTGVSVSALMAGRPPVAPLVTWQLQPAGTAAATVTAALLGVAGLLVYALRGPRAQ